jgi:hypothetical protein
MKHSVFPTKKYAYQEGYRPVLYLSNEGLGLWGSDNFHAQFAAPTTQQDHELGLLACCPNPFALDG